MGQVIITRSVFFYMRSTQTQSDEVKRKMRFTIQRYVWSRRYNIRTILHTCGVKGMSSSLSSGGSHRGFFWSLSLPTGMRPLNSLSPSIYDVETVVLLLRLLLLWFIVFSWKGFLILRRQAGSLMSAYYYVRISSINISSNSYPKVSSNNIPRTLTLN